MSDNIFSDIVFADSNVNTVEMTINPIGPSGETRTDIVVGTSKPSFSPDNDDIAFVELKVDIVLTDDDETKEQRAKFKIAITGQFIVPERLKNNHAEANHALRIAAIDKLYTQCQMLVKTLSGLSAMGEMIVPSFDPVEIVKTSGVEA